MKFQLKEDVEEFETIFNTIKKITIKTSTRYKVTCRTSTLSSNKSEQALLGKPKESAKIKFSKEKKMLKFL